jgi:17 kDa outer membrane surface antigen
MRTFRVNAPIIIGAGCLALCVLAPAPFSSMAQEQALVLHQATYPASLPTEPPGQKPSFADLRARLDESDREVALKALVIAMRELGDGATLVWRRPSKQLMGVIKPISAFRDDRGRICRRLTYSISLGSYTRQVEGVACRNPDGNWSLSG